MIDRIIHIFLYPCIAGKIIFYILGCFTAADIKLFSQTKITDAINDPKIYRFCPSTHHRINLLQRHAKHFCRRTGMYILPMQERFQKQLILCHMCKYTQFYLRIIARHQPVITSPRYKYFTDSFTDLSSYRNILQIRVST